MAQDSPAVGAAKPRREPARQPLLFASLRPYDRAWLRGDLVAGLTVWAVLVPEALAYATIAGVSPVVGLYAAPGALLLYAAFGSSRHLVVGPMSATAALSAATVATSRRPVALGSSTVTVTIALTTAMIAVGAGLLRLGFLANFISLPVMKGFIIGLALTIIAGQLPKLFGVEKGEGNFFEQLWHLAGELDATSGITLVVDSPRSRSSSACGASSRSYPARSSSSCSGSSWCTCSTSNSHGVAIVGHIDSGLPSLGLPDASAVDYLDLVPGAAGIMLVGFAEGLGAAKTYAARHHYDVDSNRELLGLGAANLGAGIAGGMVVNGSLSKTAVNGSAGAKTQLSGLVVAALTIVTLLFLTGLFEDLPEATLAAIVIAAVAELVDTRSLRRLYHSARGPGHGNTASSPPAPTSSLRSPRSLGVLVFDTLPGLFIGIARVAPAAALPCVAAEHRRARANHRRRRPVRRSHAPPGERAVPGRRHPARRRRALLRERGCACADRIRTEAAPGRRRGGRARRRDDRVSSTSPPRRCSGRSPRSCPRRAFGS